jgi:hypothetical protein
MKHCLFSYRALGLAATLGALLVAPSAASAAPYSYSGDTSFCEAGQFTQPFLSQRDTNWYEPAPGFGQSGFSGEGWTLEGGARVVSSEVPGGVQQVLDLPSGARAVSPVLCVQSNYPTARAVVRSALGGGGVAVSVGYEGQQSWVRPQPAGAYKGTASSWTLAPAMNIKPYGGYEGWQPMHIVLEGQGKGLDYNVSQLWIDPRYGH